MILSHYAYSWTFLHFKRANNHPLTFYSTSQGSRYFKDSKIYTKLRARLVLP